MSRRRPHPSKVRSVRNTGRTLVVLLLVLAVFGGGTAAFAAWSTIATGAGRAHSTDLPAGQGVSRTYTDPNAALQWVAQTINGTTVGVQGYRVQRLRASDGAVQAIGAGCAGDLTGTSCTEANVPEGTWQYQVRPFHQQWQGAWAPIGAALNVDTRAPTTLHATGVSASTINLSWVNRSTVATAIKVERSDNGTSGWSPLTSSLGPSATTYSDPTLTCGQTRHYRVTALSAANGDSVPSNVGSATTAACPTAPAAPTGLSSTAKTHTSVTLQWTDNAANETGFEVERVGNGPTVTLTRGAFTGTGTVTGFVTSGLACGTTYQYRVRATNGVGPSGWSNQISVTTDACTYVLSAPSSVTAGTAFTVTITAQVGGATNTAYSGTRTVSWSGGATSPNGDLPTYTTSVTFTNGVGTASTTLYRTGNQALTAVEGPNSGMVTVNPAPSGRVLTFTSATANDQPTSCNDGEELLVGPGGRFTAKVTVRDAYGNPNNFTANTTVGIGSSNSNGATVSPSSLTFTSSSAETTASFTATRNTNTNGNNGRSSTISATVTAIAGVVSAQCLLSN
jgi:fibronectin type 3 domain-containing protein